MNDRLSKPNDTSDSNDSNEPGLRVLSLQPWFGGSHKQFADDWESSSRHAFTTLGLPARNWKWRMRHAAIEFAKQVESLFEQGHRWDVIVCTDMMNVAEFRALSKSVRDLPLVVYFHENQFAYPNRGNQQHDQHFLFTNFVSVLSADEVWFNSQFNLDSMVAGLQQQAAHWPDFVPHDQIQQIATTSHIFPPPIAPPNQNLAVNMDTRQARHQRDQPLHLVWAARWEHDKNPQDLQAALKLLKQQRVPFRLSVIGQSFRKSPATFQEMHAEFELQIENWGYQESREAYWRVLESADVFISTASHEFFGLSVCEAISVGAWPLLPNRLAYPEVIDAAQHPERTEHFLYQLSPQALASQIRKLHLARESWDWNQLLQLVASVRQRFDVSNRAPTMDQQLANLVAAKKAT